MPYDTMALFEELGVPLKKLTELYPGKAGVLHLENYDAESESIPFVPAA